MHDCFKKYVAGGFSGVIEVMCVHPIDYIKTKRQIHMQNSMKVPFTHFLGNPYKGIVPRIFGVAPMRLVFWGVQKNTYDTLQNTKKYTDYQCSIVASLIGGSAQTIIDNPIENIKTRQMNAQSVHLKDIIKFPGFTSHLFRNIIFSLPITLLCFNNESKSNINNFFMSSLSAFIGSISTQPLDYIKTYQQTGNKNTSEMIKKTLIKNPLIFFTGGASRALVSSLSIGIGYVSYTNIYARL